MNHTRLCANSDCRRDLDDIRPRLRADARYCNPACGRAALRARRDRESAADHPQKPRLTQTERVLRALQSGPVFAADFSPPHVIDGGKPIFRVAARVGDLRKAGHDIKTRIARNGCAIYQLVHSADTQARTTDTRPGPRGGATDPVDTAAAATPPAGGGQLFDPASVNEPAPHWQDEKASDDA